MAEPACGAPRFPSGPLELPTGDRRTRAHAFSVLTEQLLDVEDAWICGEALEGTYLHWQRLPNYPTTLHVPVCCARIGWTPPASTHEQLRLNRRLEHLGWEL